MHVHANNSCILSALTNTLSCLLASSVTFSRSRCLLREVVEPKCLRPPNPFVKSSAYLATAVRPSPCIQVVVTLQKAYSRFIRCAWNRYIIYHAPTGVPLAKAAALLGRFLGARGLDMRHCHCGRISCCIPG